MAFLLIEEVEMKSEEFFNATIFLVLAGVLHYIMPDRMPTGADSWQFWAQFYGLFMIGWGAAISLFMTALPDGLFGARKGSSDLPAAGIVLAGLFTLGTTIGVRALFHLAHQGVLWPLIPFGLIIVVFLWLLAEESRERTRRPGDWMLADTSTEDTPTRRAQPDIQHH
jgi:hypothetical protein